MEVEVEDVALFYYYPLIGIIIIITTVRRTYLQNGELGHPSG